MKILYVAMAHEYGDPALGPSFEEMNFRSSLELSGHELVPFDFKARETAVGRRRMNKELVEIAADTRPDLAFFFLFEEEISPRTIRSVAVEGMTTTLNWFADDHWRFDDFSSRYAPALDWIVTTDHDAVQRYEALGHRGVILSQWACNTYAYKPTGQVFSHDVTFVGQPHGDRRDVIDRLTRAGIRAECWGHGWPGGRIEHDAMVAVFSTSRINLNLSNSSTPETGLRHRLGALARGRRAETTPRRSQIKGRTFEVPGCGGFLLTDSVPYLEHYFEPGREVGVYDGADDLVGQITYWLEHDEERAAVAEAGYRRVMVEHTYDRRFESIFARTGLG